MHLSARTTRRAGYAALPLAVLLSGVVVATTSYAAFSDTTENAGNAWSSGKVAIGDDDKGDALFDIPGLVPGDTGDGCITVTADTNVPSAVKLYTKETQDDRRLGSYLGMKIEHGTVSGDCDTFVPDGQPDFDGTLAELAAKASFADGLGGWTTTGGSSEDVTYRISYELAPTAPNDVQDAAASTTFVWEAQNV
jgi:hypothetical protein